MLSEAETVRFVEPEIVELLEGEVMEIRGRVVSGVVAGGRVPEERLKIAVTVLFVFIETVQGPEPIHTSPFFHPKNTDPAVGVGVKTIGFKFVKVSVQSVPQFIPVPVTVPKPVPSFITIRVLEIGAVGDKEESTPTPVKSASAKTLLGSQL